MTEIIRSLDELGPGYRVLFCDLWGCLHDGGAASRRRSRRCEAYRPVAGRVVLLTNSPRPSATWCAQLDRLGVPRDAGT